MKIFLTKLPDVKIFQPQIFVDHRGFFLETFRDEWFDLKHDWLQDNHSRSNRGVLRGMHFQTIPGQAKLVRCARGKIIDVVVDLRRGSPTYKKSIQVVLDEQNQKMIYVPVGFAHGFVVISKEADVFYRCSSYYDPKTEKGVAYNDPDLNIKWPDIKLIVSERDKTNPFFSEIADEIPFIYG
jgi:dTDP-4-dehydrorhamnose 3,5-epimerase